MFYILIGVIFLIVDSIVIFTCTKKLSVSIIGGFMVILPIILCMAILIIEGVSPGIELKPFTETYQLESIGTNYYLTVEKEKGVSVIAIIEDVPTNLTFPKDVVTFTTDGEKPNVSIEGNRYTEPSEQQDFWFWTGGYRQNDHFQDEYKKVVISVPEGFTHTKGYDVSTNVPEQEQEVIEEERPRETEPAETKKKFCNQCGGKLEASSKFCSQCGKKL